MPVCSYLVIPEEGAGDRVVRRLASLSPCDVVRAENRDVLLLVTDTSGPEEDRELRDTLERMEGIRALILAFGEIDPETEEADPLGGGRKEGRKMGRRKADGRKESGRSLPVVDPGSLGAAGPFPGLRADSRDP